jgi:hypothetical protein
MRTRSLMDLDHLLELVTTAVRAAEMDVNDDGPALELDAYLARTVKAVPGSTCGCLARR